MCSIVYVGFKDKEEKNIARNIGILLLFVCGQDDHLLGCESFMRGLVPLAESPGASLMFLV